MKRVNNFDDDYFEKIDCEDKAYFLGLLFADGNVYTKRNRVQLTLANEDGYILEKFAKYIGYEGKLYSDRGLYTKIILPSKKMCNDLIALGCTPRKSLTLKFPEEIPEYLIHHFIRGCFDGDGHVSRRNNCFNVNFTSSETFMNRFIELLDSLGIEHTGAKKRYPSHENSAHQLYIRSSSAIMFFNYIYKDCESLYLTRKRLIVDQPITLKLEKHCTLCDCKHFARGLCKKHYRNNYFKMNKK